ncbi:hypothetical protein DY000_02003172 [Brassica cretica]|uniref:Uncharacterized protein n=1 Tax=Brassica cretica TaxID=69181 RepID=A0ABQ7C715_BRACR|nr:hypothetical protein DY000_02003172 [Brassica cretica]
MVDKEIHRRRRRCGVKFMRVQSIVTGGSACVKVEDVKKKTKRRRQRRGCREIGHRLDFTPRNRSLCPPCPHHPPQPRL